MFVLSFENGDDDPKRYYFNKYYMPLIEIKDFNALINSKSFLSASKKQTKACENLLKWQETMTIKQEIY